MGTIKDRNSKNLTETEEIKRRWPRTHRKTIQERPYFSNNHDDVVNHLEVNILDCEVKWALGSITTNKTSADDRILAELFKILNDDAVKVLHPFQQIWKTQQWPQGWKMLVFIPIPKKGNAKEGSNYRTIVLISQASKVMLKNPSS